MMFDGLGFFGFDDTKIDRLRGKPVTWCTPFTSKKQNLILSISLVVGIFIVMSEVDKIGTQKSQMIELIPIQEYKYDVAHSIPLVSANWWWISVLFPRIREY